MVGDYKFQSPKVSKCPGRGVCVCVGGGGGGGDNTIFKHCKLYSFLLVQPSSTIIASVTLEKFASTEFHYTTPIIFDFSDTYKDNIKRYKKKTANILQINIYHHRFIY